MIGTKTKETPISAYQPSQAIVDFTAEIKKDYAKGVEILQRPWTELNGNSVIEDENIGQRMFNAFVDTSVEDPNESWKWRGTRSVARNKAIAMHANITANYLLPLFVAQNEKDEVDVEFSEIMRDGIEWMAQPTVSNYQSSFLQVSMGMLTNPVTYLKADFNEVMQDIKKRTVDGKIKKEEVLDEVLSGFQANLMSASQVLISNAYERNMQKQRFVIERRWIEYSEAKAIYGDHENWEYVQAGLKSIYSDEDGLFYDIKDDDHRELVAEETIKYRREDTEVTFLNGVYVGDSDIEANPIKHRDNRDNPKYNVTPFGYSRIGNHFFYYKSLMNSLRWDNMLVDTMYEIGMNNEILQQEMPYAITGSDQVDGGIIFPKAITAFANPDTKLVPLIPQKNSSSAFNAMHEVEGSMADSSVNDTISGQLPQASQKAFSVAQAQSNSKRLLSGVGKSLAESVISFGDLMKDIFINHYSVPQVEQMLGGAMKLKYRTLYLQDKIVGGKKSSKTIKFDEELIGQVLTEKQKTMLSIKMLDGKPLDKQKSMQRVNPEMFANFKYLTKVDIEEMFTKNQEYWQGVLPQLKQILVNDPYIDQENLDRRLMYAFFQSDGEDLIKKQSDQPQVGQQPGQPGQPPQGAVPEPLAPPSIGGNQVL